MARAGSKRPLRTVRQSRLRRSAGLRWSVFLLALLALGIQNLAVQPHVHAQPSNAVLSLEISDGEDRLAGDAPVEQAQPDCFACQSEQQQRQFLRPSDATFTSPAFINDLGIEIARNAAAHKVASHSWQGRAPPQA